MPCANFASRQVTLAQVGSDVARGDRSDCFLETTIPG